MSGCYPSAAQEWLRKTSTISYRTAFLQPGPGRSAFVDNALFHTRKLFSLSTAGSRATGGFTASRPRATNGLRSSNPRLFRSSSDTGSEPGRGHDGPRHPTRAPPILRAETPATAALTPRHSPSPAETWRPLASPTSGSHVSATAARRGRELTREGLQRPGGAKVQAPARPRFRFQAPCGRSQRSGGDSVGAGRAPGPGYPGELYYADRDGARRESGRGAQGAGLGAQTGAGASPSQREKPDGKGI